MTVGLADHVPELPTHLQLVSDGMHESHRRSTYPSLGTMDLDASLENGVPEATALNEEISRRSWVYTKFAVFMRHNQIGLYE